MTPIRPGVTLTARGEAITSPGFIGRQYGEYPLQDHWREELRRTSPETWAWVEAKKIERAKRKPCPQGHPARFGQTIL